jgi:hypothetical protein
MQTRADKKNKNKAWNPLFRENAQQSLNINMKIAINKDQNAM